MWWLMRRPRRTEIHPQPLHARPQTPDQVVLAQLCHHEPVGTQGRLQLLVLLGFAAQGQPRYILVAFEWEHFRAVVHRCAGRHRRHRGRGAGGDRCCRYSAAIPGNGGTGSLQVNLGSGGQGIARAKEPSAEAQPKVHL